MARRSTGQLRSLGDGGFAARIPVAEGKRKWFKLTGCRGEDAAAERCKALADLAARLRRTELAARDVETLLKQAARATAGRPWLSVLEAVDTVCERRPVDHVSNVQKPTFETFANDWTSGELAKRFPDHVKAKATADDDRSLLKNYVNPVLGPLRLDEITLDDADRVLANLPEKSKIGKPFSSATRRHVAQIVRRLLKLAVYPGKHITQNPIPSGWLPKVKRNHALTYLYPEEDAKLMGCVGTGTEDDPGIPLIRRLFYGVLAREGMRRSELAGLRWRDVDLARGGVTLDVNKTKDPRAWPLDRGVARALKAWKERHHADAKPEDRIFRDATGTALYVDQLAEELQADLVTAKVTREELFERSAVRRPIRVHDLRATFVTLSLANGRTEAWVTDRTGHRSSAILHRYRRAARTVAEMDGRRELVALDAAIPELAAEGATHPEGPSPGSGEGGTGSGETPASAGGDAGSGPRNGPRAEAARDASTPKLADLAERVGFEPTLALRLNLISNQIITSETTRDIEKTSVEATPRSHEISPDGPNVARSTAPIRPDRPPREAVIAALGRHLAELAAAGDVAAARAVHEAIGRLLQAPLEGAGAPVIDLAERRRREP